MLGNLRNHVFVFFVKVDQWDNSIRVQHSDIQNDKQIKQCSQESINQQITLKVDEEKNVTKPVQSRVQKTSKKLISGYELNNGKATIQS